MINPFLKQLGDEAQYRRLLYAKFEYDKAKRPRWLRLLLAIDQLFNVLLLNGSQDETISSHIGRRMETGRASWAERALARFLNLFESRHCDKSKGE